MLGRDSLRFFLGFFCFFLSSDKDFTDQAQASDSLHPPNPEGVGAVCVCWRGGGGGMGGRGGCGESFLAEEKEEGNRLAPPVCLCFPAARRERGPGRRSDLTHDCCLTSSVSSTLGARTPCIHPAVSCRCRRSIDRPHPKTPT